MRAVFEAMNKVPQAQHGTDIMRVRESFLSGNDGAYRQTLLMSSLMSAEMNALTNRACANWAGRVRLRVDHQVRCRLSLHRQLCFVVSICLDC